MSERISLDFLAARLAALQDGIRDLRDSHEGFADRVSGVEVTISNLGNQVVRTLALDNRRITRLDQRLDAMTRRMERLEEAQLRLADMVADTKQELAQAGQELAQVRQTLAQVASEQSQMKGMLAEVLRRLPPAPG